jgi:hypothetical protein
LNTYNVTLKYEDRNAGSEGRTIKVDASSIAGAIGKATREFVKGLDRKQRFDMNKGLKIANTPTPWGLSYLFVKLSSRSRSTGILSCEYAVSGETSGLPGIATKPDNHFRNSVHRSVPRPTKAAKYPTKATAFSSRFVLSSSTSAASQVSWYHSGT